MKIVNTKPAPYSKKSPAELVAKRLQLQEVGNVGMALRKALENAGK